MGPIHKAWKESIATRPWKIYLNDDDFMNQLVLAMTKANVMDDLVEEFANKLKDALGNNPEFRLRLLKAVVATETCESKLISRMARITG